MLEWDWQAPLSVISFLLLLNASRSCLQESVLQRDSSPPTTWPTLQRAVTAGWTETLLLEQPGWKSSPIWRVQVMGELKARAEPLQLLTTPGLGWIPVPLPGNGRRLTSVLFPWQNAFFWVSPQSSVWGVVLERLNRTGFSATLQFSKCGYEERKERNQMSWFRTNSLRHAFPTAFNKMCSIFL